MHSLVRSRTSARVPHRRLYRPRLETLEGRLPPGGMLAGLTLGAVGTLPDLASPDADAATTSLVALTADHSDADGSPPNRWAVPDREDAQPVPYFPNEPSTSGGRGASVAPATMTSGDDLASSLAADPWQGWTGLHVPSVNFPAVTAGSAAETDAGGTGPFTAPDSARPPAVGLSDSRTAGERLPLAGPSHAAVPAPTTPTSVQAAQIRQAYGLLPLRFEANAGQTDARVQFLAHGPGYQLFLTGTEAVMTLQPPAAAAAPDLAAPNVTLPTAGPSTVLRMQVLGGNPAAHSVGVQPLPGQVNYFLGNDPRRWHTHVSTYGRVDYVNIYPGIDLTYYGNQQQLEYDFVVAPGADPSCIRLGFAGADGLTVDSQGALEVQAGEQVLRQQAPVVYQDVAGVRQPVAGRFVVAGHTVSFAVGAYDTSRPLVIDPVLSYSSYLGGSGSGNGGDIGYGIAVDAAGNAYVTGSTNSPDFPTANALQPTTGGNYDAFVTELSADGSSLVYSSYLGGSGNDYGQGIAVDAAGNAYVIGYTSSPDFPTTNGFQPTYGGGATDAFVAEVLADGSSLAYSSYLGGSGYDYGYGIAVDAAGNAYVTGYTTSTDFPTANAFQPSKGATSGSNAFVAKVSADGSSLLYSSYLGGSGIDGDDGYGIAVDAAGNAYVTGDTTSTDFPTANALQPAKGGGPYTSSAFVTEVSADGANLVYSTYLGGSGYTVFGDYGSGIAVDATGNAYVTGNTYSTDFPTANAFQPIKGGALDNANAFVTKVSADGSSLVYSSYLGGSGYGSFYYGDAGQGIAVDATGNAYLTGITYSTDFPTANAFQPSKGGPSNTSNAFVTEVSADGSSLVYSSYLGGSGYDSGKGIAVDGAGNAYLTGYTYSTDFPTANAFQPAKGGAASTSNAFVTKLSGDGSRPLP